MRILLYVLDACVEGEYEIQDSSGKRVSNTNLSISILNRWNVIRWESPFDEPQHYRVRSQSESSGKKFSTPSVTQPITPETAESERANRGGKKEDKCVGNSMK